MIFNDRLRSVARASCESNSMKYEGQHPGKVGFGKYFSDVTSSQGMVIRDSELDAVKKYNLALKDGGDKQVAFRKYLSATSEELQQIANTANGAAIQYQQIGSSALVGASGMDGLKNAANLVKMEFGAMMKSFALFYVVSEAINLLFKGLQKLWSMVPTQDHLLEWAAESAQQLEETQSSLESLNGELETTQDRIAELRNKGPLSLVEKEELAALEEANAKLERQKALLEAQEKTQKQKASDDAYKALKGYSQTIRKEDRTKEEITIDEQIRSATDSYNKAKQNAASAKNSQQKESYVRQMNYAEESLLDLATKAEEQINNIDLSNASAEVKAFVLSTKSAINEGLLANGTLKVKDLLGEVFNEDEFRIYGSKLNQLLENKNFEFNTTSLREQLGEEFVTACEDAGISAEDLAEHLQKLKNSGGKIEVRVPTLEDSIDEISNMESAIGALSNACNEFADNGGKVSIETIEGVAEAFDSMSGTKEFKNAITVLSDSSSSVAEVEDAMNGLVNAYLNSEDVMRNLTDKNKELYINQLRQMGVSNAQEVVEYKLAVAKLQNASATEEEKKQARAQIQAVLESNLALNANATASLNAAQKTALLATYESYVTGSSFAQVVSNNAKMLYAVGMAAGTAGKSLAEYAEIMLAIQELQKDPGLGSKIAIGALITKAIGIRSDAEAAYRKMFTFDTNYSPTTPSSTPTSGDSTPKKKPSEKRRDEYNAAKEKLDDKLQKNQISYERYYKRLTALGKKYLKDQKGNAADYRQHLNDVIAARREVFSHAKEQLDQKYEQGIIGIRTYYKKTKELMDKWLKGRKSTEEDYANASIELSKKVVQSWNDRISSANEYIDRRDLRQDWIPGQDAVSYLEKEMARLQEDYAAGLFGSTEDFLEVYNKLEDKLIEARKDAAEAELDKIEKRVDSINDLTDMVSDMLKQRYEDTIDALEKQVDKYKEIIDQKKKSLDLTRDELSYQKEMKEQGEELAKMQAKAAVLALDNSREGKAKYAALMDEIRQKQEDISEKQADRAYDAKVKALDEASDAYEKAMQTKIDGLNEQMEHAGKWQEYVYSYIKNTNPSRLLEELKEYNYQYGNGLLTAVTDIWTECESLLTKYGSDIVKLLQAQKDAEQEQKKNIGDSENPSVKGMTTAQVQEAIKPKNTQTNTDEDNSNLVDRLIDGGWNKGKVWYDKKNKVIYMGDQGDRRITAHAYKLIKKMKEINDSKKSKKDKEGELKPMMEQLNKLWSYGEAHLEWNSKEKKFHLHKYKGTSAKWQIFHNGLSAGFVGSYVPTPKQNETYALLQKGELVLNRADQKRLGIQMQALTFLTEGLHRTGLSGISSGGLGMGDIVVNVQAPVTIEGNADANTVKALREYGDYISGQTLSKLQFAMNRRGYASRTAANAMKRQ